MKIRCEIEIGELDQDFRTIAGRHPAVWAGNAVSFQILLRRAGVIANDDVDSYDFLKLTILAESRSGAAYATQTVAAAQLDITLTEENWADGTKQHVEFSFDPSELELPITEGANETKYWLVISAGTPADALAPGTVGGTDIYFNRDGIPASPTYVQAGNIIPGGATYNGSGQYSLAVTTGRVYKWTDGGANDTSVTNGAETVTVSNSNFITQGATITLNGTAGQPVTAIIYPSPGMTGDDVLALIANYLTSNPVTGVLVGESAVGNGVEQVVVDISALGLGATPSSILAEVVKPNVGAMIWCSIVAGTATATQFTVQLSAITELATYKIRYHVKP